MLLNLLQNEVVERSKLLVFALASPFRVYEACFIIVWWSDYPNIVPADHLPQDIYFNYIFYIQVHLHYTAMDTPLFGIESYYIIFRVPNLRGKIETQRDFRICLSVYIPTYIKSLNVVRNQVFDVQLTNNSQKQLP